MDDPAVAAGDAAAVVAAGVAVAAVDDAAPADDGEPPVGWTTEAVVAAAATAVAAAGVQPLQLAVDVARPLVVDAADVQQPPVAGLLAVGQQRRLRPVAVQLLRRLLAASATAVEQPHYVR